MKKILLTLTMIFLVFNLGINVEAKAHLKVNSHKVSHSATGNINYLELNEEKVIYDNGEEKVTVILEEVEPIFTTFGSTNWSGTIPDGISTITVKYESGGVYTASYKAQLKGLNNSIVGVNSPYVNIVGMSNLSVSYFGIQRAVAGTNLPARASMQYSYTYSVGGVNLGTFYKYLDIELNTDGQYRIYWP